jgi:hypothetical protein
MITSFNLRLEAVFRPKPFRLDPPISAGTGLVEGKRSVSPASKKKHRRIGRRSDLPRASRKRGGKASKRGLSAEQIPVMVACDRSGATIDAVLPHLDTASVAAALDNIITRPAELCCDGGAAITAFARRARIKFHVLPAPGIPKPEAPQLHINNVNARSGSCAPARTVLRIRSCTLGSHCEKLIRGDDQDPCQGEL